ncbi:thiosulfate reductase electron transport protein PhsB [Leminorella grimontii]|uniref:Thiosulfate reductase electron transport protein PhsB n=1 Tax=Leminorella grimontii TaxID=82981 RepID=A0AAV5MWN4_9GAMM|nr:4Fe-4S dicluster domain-containing protein [Leminorella grimontii]KFC96550.1 thiosulfate reductase electron transport protein [Leminorella grimontii ATCC 33999 = DSM 5078]GKX54253.1 thiosulfate reductase electron transport protein PhsB [Leminorella grimontii]GKX57694.1 thiosulfate reductase electron transport protein PhsB [Leminorella grimontii]VFS59669.1 DMSO reductase iron-sulfur subunit [Leminorella grimontii]
MSNNHYVMLHDEKRCIGCQACTVACKTMNDIPEGYSRLQVQIRGPEEGAGAMHFQFFRVSCQHCEDAPCISVCPTGASWRDENGVVRVDAKKCLGCDYCVAACPYHVRYLNPQTHVADKCNFCADTRLAQGLEPACVSVCPTDALRFGRADEPAIKQWISQHGAYQYHLENVGKPALFRRKEIHQGDKA